MTPHEEPSTARRLGTERWSRTRGQRATLYVFPHEGELYADANYEAQIRSPHEFTICLSVNSEPFDVRLGEVEHRVTAMAMPHAQPRAIDARGCDYVAFRVQPAHPRFRKLTAGGARPLDRSLFNAFDVALKIAQLGEMSHADARQLFEDVVEQVCALLPPVPLLDERVRAALNYIDERMDVSLDEIATIMGVSPSRSSHLFTENLGMSLRSYLTWGRLSKSWLLMTSKSQRLTLTEVAHRLGFSDSSHLTRTFRSLMGHAPSDMRNPQFIRIIAP